MPDYGAQYADKELEKLERRIKSIYSQTHKELQEKFAEFTRKYAVKDAEKRALVKAGKMTEDEYKWWLQGQVFQGEQWQHRIKQAAEAVTNADVIAYKAANSAQNGVFAENYNYIAYTLEQQIGVNMAFAMADEHTLDYLLKEDRQLLPRKQINTVNNVRYNSKIISQYAMQGILQGESVDKVADRILNGVVGTERRYALINARTAITSAQNCGRQQMLNDAVAMGIDCEKEWIATLDSRTRESHQQMDGERVPYNKKFSNGLMFPGDPAGPGSEVYNCRCTMGYDLADSPSRNATRYDQKNKRRIENISYQEWKRERKENDERAAFGE